MLSRYNQRIKKEILMNIAQVVQFVASIAWLIAIGLIVLTVVRASRGQPVKGFSTGVVAMLVVALGLSIVGAGVVFIEPDELAVVITVNQGGIRPEPLNAGIHLIIPVVERVETYSILRQTYTMSAVGTEGQVSGDDSIQVRTKDGQQVYIDASVIYSVDPRKAVDLYRTWRKDYENGLVRPQSRGVSAMFLLSMAWKKLSVPNAPRWSSRSPIS
jgi:regulator of protease activity HflC (stomatin/prohibitin superfamily)